ncbi:hypothetical protein CRI93_03215 [Longimonas halophila]|uniref:Uncharacterized protein n=1 Tax=Longimonas halophila TaxID=1469170 RepID=A0A2H3P9Q9_9BACT|nr:oligosaccharide flippase family protein [Longimonas halophila]PEN08781.1 hypothetical protein CRI93_03215 [Longimonas halophila]
MSESTQDELRRGALVNTLGTLGKLAGPSLLIVVTRLYGADVFGIFITAVAFIEAGLAFLTAGFRDGALISVARHADHDDETDKLYQLLSNTLGWSLGFAVILAGLVFVAGPQLIPLLYDSYGTRLLHMLQWMVLALPILAFDRIVIAATQGLKIMKYDAISNGGLRPVTLLATGAGFWFWMPSETGMALAYVSTQALLGVVALYVYSRELEWKPLWQAFRTFTLDRELMRFAIPQNLNMTLERFLTNIDVLMLGMFGVSARTTGFYGAGAMIVRELLSIKQVFSNAYAPFIVRLHRAGRTAELSKTYSRTTLWVITIAIPALLAVGVMRNDLLRLVSPEFAGLDTLFMLLLLPIPYLQCSFSLAGNIVVMTGHSRLNLLNSTITGVLNVLLNVWLIPVLGLVGAALASTIATSVKMALEVVEAHWVANARLLISEIFRPHLAGALVVVGLWSAEVFWGDATGTLFGRGLMLATGLAAYTVILIVLNGRIPAIPGITTEREPPTLNDDPADQSDA